MRYFITPVACFLSLSVFGQDLAQENEHNNRQGEFTVYWGWNRGWYSNSDINFSGENYDFTLYNVVANDRQTKFDPAIYFHPKWITIPQTNFRIGYFIKTNYEISLGVDHMKYVVQQNQTTTMSGEIANSGTEHDGTYSNDEIVIRDGFLQLEHTDGLNYVNLEYRRFDNIFTQNNLSINLTEGLGTGFLLPKTNTSLFQNERHDQFHLSGFGVNAVFALNVYFKSFFIQSELKGGFMNMPDIRTTNNRSDRASQHFFFTQANFLIGTKFRF